MPLRVGSLDNPSRYGKSRALAVYAKTTGGLFFRLDGQREPVRAHRWTSLDGTSMRGHVPVDALPLHDSDDEEAQIAAAIAASLRELGQDAPAADAMAEPDPPSAEPDVPMAEPDVPSARACVICMSATPDHVIKPCAHLCLCGGCAARVRRERLPCPVCRRAQRSIERVFHA